MLLDERPHDLSAPGWLYHLKYDGWRLMAEFGKGQCRLKTKSGSDATRWFPELARSLAAFKTGPNIIDGEVCVLDDLGRPDFERMQDRGKMRGYKPGADLVTFVVFDLLAKSGKWIGDKPIERRQEALHRLFDVPAERVLVAQTFPADTDMQHVFDNIVVPLKLEGLVAKRAGSVYEPGVRSAAWLKIKRKGATPPERFKRR